MYIVFNVVIVTQSKNCFTLFSSLFIRQQNPDLIEEWKEGTGLALYEGYGQTETVKY